MPAQETISEQTSPAPWRRPWRRNAWTLTPAIGARTTRVGISTSRIHHDSWRTACIEAKGTPHLVDVDPGVEVPCAPAGRRVTEPSAVYAPGFRRTAALKEVILTPDGFKKLQAEIEFLNPSGVRNRGPHPRSARVRRHRRE